MKIWLGMFNELNNRPFAPPVFADDAERLRLLDDIRSVMNPVILAACLD
jgi:hypothetical protein